MTEISEESIRKLSVPITPLLEQICYSTRLRQQIRHKVWINASHKIASKIPNSLAACTTQFLGDLDMMLLCMEEELLLVRSGKMTATPLLGLNYQVSFSEMWVCKAYELCRAMKKRDSAPQTDSFQTLFKNLEGLRVSLDKFEIARDQKKKLEVDLAPMNAGGTFDLEKVYHYSYSDELKGHMMPMEVDPSTGALQWMVTHAEEEKSYSLNRRVLSDAFLDCFADTNI